MTIKSLILFSVCLGTGVLLSGCQEQPGTSSQEEYPRSQTLYVGGFDWAPPSSFNPLAGDPSWPIDGNIKLIYESLFAYDQNSGNLEPMLAKSYRIQDNTIEVQLDERARWSNGTPVTPQDVAYSFLIDSLLPTPRHSNWNFLSSVLAIDSNRVLFSLRKEQLNPLIVLDMLSEVSILPQAVWSKILESSKNNYDSILAYKNDSLPVASGPYSIHKYSPERIVLERRSDYWGNAKHQGKQPAPTFIIHSLYKDNSEFNQAMSEGKLDLSSIFLPRIWTKAPDSIRGWSLKEPYHLPGSIPTLFIGLTQEPFNDVAFRRALAHSVNFEKIKLLAVSNYTPAVRPGFILPFGSESKYYSQADADSFGYSFDIEAARKILADAGYKWDTQDRLLLKSGKPLRSISLECPKGWTDWEDAIKVVVESFRQLGIDAAPSFVEYPVWDKNVKQGTFDLIMKTQTADLFPSTPWKRFEQVMSSTGNKPLGEDVFSNFGRYKNARADQLLNTIPRLTEETKSLEAYRELNQIFMKEIPVLPLMYRPTQFYQFSTKHWNNFPTQENPYASPQNLMIGAGVKALWSINPVEK
jgi:peptide/nickel transport system substrate-binding protein